MPPTIYEVTPEQLVEQLVHVSGCGACEGWGVHRWGLDQWMVVLGRILPGKWSPAKDSQSLMEGSRVVEAVFKVIWILGRRRERRAVETESENQKLREELTQNAGGTRRTLEEIIAAGQQAAKIVRAPRVPARSQYAAARVLEALQWVLEAPLGETKTGFHPHREDGIA